MTYGVSVALQGAVYTALTVDVALAALAGDAIYDAVPPGEAPDLYVVLGPETVRDRSDVTGRGARHAFTVSVISTAQGFARAKAAAGAVSDTLSGADLTLARGRLVSLAFHRARAAKTGRNDIRQIDLVFHARVEDD
ncbi:DUF3168 domain-containing protein [Roseisalinus antarcticus]|uniref:Gene transfer agent protein n=1 Tax=Roseisalinus antarcticus TaxID=254357 RepID=A0A1Y5T5M6_9RHOB|nr:DUF3168 domain-containing protein [Roseisalinus antarcticus]SLN54485.1 hypothetical protein ROA7023_02445 [Roseisalinus antarcticus]